MGRGLIFKLSVSSDEMILINNIIVILMKLMFLVSADRYCMLCSIFTFVILLSLKLVFSIAEGRRGHVIGHFC